MTVGARRSRSPTLWGFVNPARTLTGGFEISKKESEFSIELAECFFSASGGRMSECMCACVCAVRSHKGRSLGSSSSSKQQQRQRQRQQVAPTKRTSLSTYTHKQAAYTQRARMCACVCVGMPPLVVWLALLASRCGDFDLANEPVDQSSVVCCKPSDKVVVVASEYTH